MSDLQALVSPSIQMTSKEIAGLVESRHDKVKQSIERLADRGVIELPPTGEISTATKPVTVYVFTGEQGKRDSIVVVAQLSPVFTARLVDRWQELEAKLQQSIPNFDDPVAAARAWADQREASLIAQQKALALSEKIETDRPLTDLARALTGKDTVTRRDWIAMMKEDSEVSLKEKAVNQWLIDSGYCYREPIKNEMRAYAHNSHLFKLEPESINGAYRMLLKLTGEGVLRLTPLIIAHFRPALDEGAEPFNIDDIM